MFHRGTFDGSRIWMPPQQAAKRRDIHEDTLVGTATMHEYTLAKQIQGEASYCMILLIWYCMHSIEKKHNQFINLLLFWLFGRTYLTKIQKLLPLHWHLLFVSFGEAIPISTVPWGGCLPNQYHLRWTPAVHQNAGWRGSASSLQALGASYIGGHIRNKTEKDMLPSWSDMSNTATMSLEKCVCFPGLQKRSASNWRTMNQWIMGTPGDAGSQIGDKSLQVGSIWPLLCFLCQAGIYANLESRAKSHVKDSQDPTGEALLLKA